MERIRNFTCENEMIIFSGKQNGNDEVNRERKKYKHAIIAQYAIRSLFNKTILM